MPEIHPTAILDGNISLAGDVIIGPHCVLRGDIAIGSGTKLIGNCYLTGKLVLGSDNVVYPFTSIGFASQDINYPNDMYDPGIVIGDRNVFRENFTAHRATQEAPTTIGNDNMFMASSHVAHDCVVGNNNTLVNCVLLGGHVHIQDKVLIGGDAAVHQFVTIGSGAMIIGMGYASYDLLPYFMITGPNIVGSINIIGMRRSGMPNNEIRRRKDIYKLLYKSGNTINTSVKQLKEAGDPVAMEYVHLIESSRRGIIAPFHTTRSERRGVVISHE
ncbi:MAG: acyl-ACP--UDP-N-acetylglucosamine O-acyltransferase [Phycisphaerae bacterium]|jgi:UDP-N-acetylglucosamine acyltransferase|nr:acyl-ACP--UDP-N-acetylglucosamine O-acyltransferase [Phycisphaerae bacterium]